MLELSPHKGSNKKTKVARYDMKTGKQGKMKFENSADEFSSLSYSTTIEEESTTSNESDSSREEVMGLILTEPNKVDPLDILRVKESKLAKMLAKDLMKEEKQAYLTMLKDFPRLFVEGYDQITRVTVVQHHINLKKGSFIYPIDDSDWVSPVVVTPKKNGKWQVCVDYKPLNAPTKKDHFPLPFQDEILNEVIGYESSRGRLHEKRNSVYGVTLNQFTGGDNDQGQVSQGVNIKKDFLETDSRNDFWHERSDLKEAYQAKDRMYYLETRSLQEWSLGRVMEESFCQARHLPVDDVATTGRGTLLHASNQFVATVVESSQKRPAACAANSQALLHAQVLLHAPTQPCNLGSTCTFHLPRLSVPGASRQASLFTRDANSGRKLLAVPDGQSTTLCQAFCGVSPFPRYHSYLSTKPKATDWRTWHRSLAPTPTSPVASPHHALMAAHLACTTSIATLRLRHSEPHDDDAAITASWANKEPTITNDNSPAILVALREGAVAENNPLETSSANDDGAVATQPAALDANATANEAALKATDNAATQPVHPGGTLKTHPLGVSCLLLAGHGEFFKLVHSHGCNTLKKALAHQINYTLGTPVRPQTQPRIAPVASHSMLLPDATMTAPSSLAANLFADFILKALNAINRMREDPKTNTHHLASDVAKIVTILCQLHTMHSHPSLAPLHGHASADRNQVIDCISSLSTLDFTDAYIAPHSPKHQLPPWFFTVFDPGGSADHHSTPRFNPLLKNLQ
ncbi:hypothetical protein L7F22_061943 [Adiantum nelumboides]|nr:hypothetical protein [Adiantum nelumboides]